MKKFLVASAVMGMLVFLPMAANAECNCPCAQQKGEINVSASAEKEIAPDTVQISIQVVTTDTKSMQKAALQNKEISDKIYTALKAMINPANNDFIKTSNYNATPVYVYNNNKKNLDKYQVSNSIQLRTKNIDKIGAIIDKATGLGATEVNDLNFSVSNYESQCDDLIAQAAQKARTKANILAKNSVATILGVKSISASCSSSANNNARVYMRTMKLMAVGANADTSVEETYSPISAGSVKLNATVDASYYAK
ncbi:MAG: SIMPL domain-containing protein [Clostridiaceae bacterium]|jgi:uncharacterized protein|nr:SIMPL domain-containing protein [Clostridiaceae bacterium]